MIKTTFVFLLLLFFSANSFGQFPVDTIHIDTILWENKTIKQLNFHTDLFNFSFIAFHSNGIKHYEGRKTDLKTEIINLWDNQGNQTVINGEGRYFDYYFNGNLKENGPIHNRSRGHIWIEYYMNGQKKSEGSYNDRYGNFTNVRYGKWTFWYENGKKSKEVEYQNNFESQFLNAWDKHGNKTLSNGYGILYEYFPNGNIKEFGQIKHEQKWGQWIKYYSNGKMDCQINLNYVWNNEINDSILNYKIINAWDTNGVITLSNATGYKIDYDENGNKLKYWQYKNGIMDSLFIEFYKNGQIKLKDTYKVGKLLNRTWYHTNGNIAISPLDNFNILRTWYSNGTLKSELWHLNDSNYTEIGFYKNGKKMFISNCEVKEVLKDGFGSEQTICIIESWNENGVKIEKK